MRVSQSKVLKIKNVSKSKVKKTTWKVSNKKKLKLTQKKKTSVKLTGRKTGTVKVKAIVKIGGKTYKLTTTVKISKKQSKKKVEIPSTPEQSDTSDQPSIPEQPNTPGQSGTPTQPDTPVQTEAVEVMKLMEGLPLSSTYEKTVVPPDLLTMLDGTKVTTKEQWGQRRKEIKAILERYMYGVWRDGSEEEVSYSVSSGKINITIKRGDKQSSFSASYTTPSGTAPEGGWPVIVSVGGFSNSYVEQKGYAIISFTPTDIASDNTSRTGAFYTLYPYKTADWKEQTGSVMAWAWGASKIIDALEKGAGAELGISPVYTVVTGVSRYGKAAAAAGAFEERFKVSMPVCSGYGGMTMARYNSNNLTYNLLPDFENDPKKEDVADLSVWKSTGGTEPINSLQGAGWFNEEYKNFATYQNLPFDAHYIAALSAMEGRYMFIVTGINSDMWSSPPGFWWCYNEAKPAFDLMGLSDNLAIQMHLNLHGIETVDLCKLFAYTDYHFYNKTTDPATFPEPWNEVLAGFTLDSLKTCIFASAANAEAYEAGMPVDPDLLPPNPDVKALIKLMFDGEETETSVSRSQTSDGLVTELTGEQAGTGFGFTYGHQMQYGESYTRFDLVLPEGKKLSDYSSVTFTCQTDGNYYGKKMALVANPKSIGLPAKIEYDYNSGEISNAINLSGGKDFPNNTASAKELTLQIDSELAASLDDEDVELSIYIHMEHGDGSAQYTITNITFNS